MLDPLFLADQIGIFVVFTFYLTYVTAHGKDRKRKAARRPYP